MLSPFCSLYTGSNQTTLHWTTSKRLRPWERLIVALPTVTRCLCLGVHLQMSLLPRQYVQHYCHSPSLSMCISKRDCSSADSLVLWATQSPFLLKRKFFAFQLPCYLLSLKSVVVAFCLHPFSLSFTFNILFRVTRNSGFIHQSFSAARAMMGCSYLPMPSQPLQIAFCTLVYNLWVLCFLCRFPVLWRCRLYFVFPYFMVLHSLVYKYGVNAL